MNINIDQPQENHFFTPVKNNPASQNFKGLPVKMTDKQRHALNEIMMHIKALQHKYIILQNKPALH